MLSFVLVLFVCPATLLFICGYLHCRNHFEIKIKRNNKFQLNSNSSRHIHNVSSNAHLNVELQHSNAHPLHLSQISHLSEMSTFSASYKEPRAKRLKHCLSILNMIQSKDSDWNFFPISFLLYLLLIFLLTFIIILKYHKYTYSAINNSCSTHLYQTRINKPLITDHNITDWIILYSIIILNMWESLLNFYRYWTTRECSMLRISDSITLYLYYSIYFFLFLILSILQFHWIYWLSPVLIITHCSYNLFCVWQFTLILIKQYHAFSNPDRQVLTIVNDNMLSSAKIMGYISFLSFSLNSILLSFIVSCYNINVICYLPLIYSISSFSFSFNFVRNRVSLKHFIIKIQQIPIQLREWNTTDGVETDDECITDNHQSPKKLNHLTLEQIQITSAPSSIFDETENKEINIGHDETEMESNKNVSNDKSKSKSNDTLMLMVPYINTKNSKDDNVSSSATATPNQQTNLKRSQSNNDSTYPFKSMTNTTNTVGDNHPGFLDAYRNKSRSEPSSPLIYNETCKHKHKQHNIQFATPQIKARLSQSPVLNWVKQLSLKAGLKVKSYDENNDYAVVSVVGSDNNKSNSKKCKHKRGCKSEGLPQFSELVTHSISFDDDNKNENNITNTVLSVFGEKPASPSKKGKGKKALDILGIDENDEKDEGEFVYVDDEFDADAFDVIVNDDFSLHNLGVADSDCAVDTQENVNKNGKNELKSYEKWNAFDSIFPSKELRLEQSTSEQKVALHCGSKRNSKISQSQNRRSSLLNRDDMLKAVQLEINIGDIKEDEEENVNQYEFNDHNIKYKLGKSTKDDEIVSMLKLMVQHGFYSKKTLNSIEELRKYNSSK